ncbi:MAG: ATP-dependent metallopeptidase FtsH/Yme1/Tma family protein, partial [Clostridium saudiense]|nr:ATP-dependent metallopeptidase FtsH/Yme1/Tma family protein [Clostridium saudiense]
MNNNVNNRKGGEKKKNNNNKFLLIYVVVAFLFLYSFSTAKEMLTTKEISYNEFVQMVKDKEVKEVTVDGTALVITPQDSSDMKGKVLYTGNADNPDLIQLLIDNDVQYYPQITKQQSVWMDFIILNVLP